MVRKPLDTSKIENEEKIKKELKMLKDKNKELHRIIIELEQLLMEKSNFCENEGIL